jgi:glucosamine-6-phosphate deaminase
LGLYAELGRRVRAGLDLSRAHAFNLDEYVGLGPEHPLSCAAFMHAHAYPLLGLQPAHCHVPDGRAADLAEACRRYERAIDEAGGLGLAVLGLGRNGHLAMNEPGTSFDSRTQICTLAPQTLADNARLYPAGATLPEHGATMGLATLRGARAVLLLAFGARKAEAIAAALAGPIDRACPASCLQGHPALTVVIDRAAAVALPA